MGQLKSKPSDSGGLFCFQAQKFAVFIPAIGIIFHFVEFCFYSFLQLIDSLLFVFLNYLVPLSQYIFFSVCKIRYNVRNC